MMDLTLHLMSEALFGTARLVDQDLRTAITFTERYLLRQGHVPVVVPPVLPTRRNRQLWWARRILDQAIDTVIHLQKERGERFRHTVLWELLQEDLEGKPANIHSELRTLILAGHETTASLLMWTWYLLSLHEDVEQACISDIRSILGEGQVKGSDLPDLPRIHRVLQEALRLYPPVWLMSRRAETEDVICGCRIPKHALVFVCPWSLHRDARLWPDPDRFDPDRFLPERSTGRPLSAFCPFGGGTHRCIGEHLALFEASLIVVMVLQRYHLRLLTEPVHAGKPGIFPALRPRHVLSMEVCSRE